jgi:hypothetical protein
VCSVVNHTGTGYNVTMRFRVGLVTGLATGYYLGARAGRQRYDQINRAVSRLKRSDAFEAAAERAKSAVEEGVEKAIAAIPHKDDTDDRDHASTANGQGAGPTAGIILPTEPPTGLGGYSSSR